MRCEDAGGELQRRVRLRTRKGLWEGRCPDIIANAAECAESTQEEGDGKSHGPVSDCTFEGQPAVPGSAYADASKAEAAAGGSCPA